MLSINIHLDDSKAQALTSHAPDEIASALEDASREALQILLRAVQGNIARPPLAARDTGTLYESVFFEPRGRPEFGGIVDVHPPADVYAAPLEFGSVPHLPPVQALYGWVERHFQPADEKQLRSIAWAIAMTIAKKGNIAHGMFSRAVASSVPAVGREFEDQIAAALAALDE